MLALGLDVVDVIAMATSNAARAIGKLDEYGSLDVGRAGEISVSRLRTDGPFPVSDGHETAVAETAIEPIGCVRSGAWYPARSLPTFATVGKTWGPALDDSDW